MIPRNIRPQLLPIRPICRRNNPRRRNYQAPVRRYRGGHDTCHITVAFHSNIRCAVCAFDEQQIPANIRDTRVTAGVGDRVVDGGAEDAHTAGIRERVARRIGFGVHWRAEGDGGSIGGKAHAPTGEVVVCFAVDIGDAALGPFTRCRVEVVDADVAAVGTGCAGVVVGGAYREGVAVGGEAEAVSGLVAAGGDFVGGVLGPGDAVVAGEVEEAGSHASSLVLTGGRYGDITPSQRTGLRSPSHTKVG